jgi:hypothetical protein
MGRTLLPFRPALDREIATWNLFKKGLSSKDQVIFTQLMQYARQHGDAGSLAARPLISEVIFLSVAIEQYNSIQALQDQLHTLDSKLQNLYKIK